MVRFVAVTARYFPRTMQHLSPKCWPSIGESLSLWRPTTTALMSYPTYPDPTIGKQIKHPKLFLTNGEQKYSKPLICISIADTTSAYYKFVFGHPVLFFFLSGQFLIQKVVPQASGESSKVKVKVRVNIHGIFSVSSASLVEVQKSDETEEPMETEQANEKEGEVLQPNMCLFFFRIINQP